MKPRARPPAQVHPSRLPGTCFDRVTDGTAASAQLRQRVRAERHARRLAVDNREQAGTRTRSAGTVRRPRRAGGRRPHARRGALVAHARHAKRRSAGAASAAGPRRGQTGIGPARVSKTRRDGVSRPAVISPRSTASVATAISPWR